MDTTFIIIIIIVVLLLVTKKLNSNDNEVKPDLTTENKFLINLGKLKSKGFDSDTLRFIEKIYRLETRNFESVQFKKTYSAGMEVANPNKKHYGWDSKLFINPPTGFEVVRENKTGINKRFVKFNNMYDAMFVLASYIKKYNNPYRWFSLDNEKQNIYADSLKNIKTPIYEKL